MFQKHKWCKFLQQNPDIKALWVQLPRSKCTNKGSRQKENIHQEELSYQDSPENISDDFSFINELNQIQDNFSVSEAHFPNEEFENNQAKTEFLENIEESSFAFDVSTPTELNVDDQEEDFTDSFWKEWKDRSFKYSQATPF